MTGESIAPTLAHIELLPTRELRIGVGYISADQKYINSKLADTANFPIMLIVMITQLRPIMK